MSAVPAIVIGLPLSGFAQFVDKGEYVEVSKGVKLCSNGTLDTSNGMLNPENRFWRVTSKARANGTETVASFVLESLYDCKNGETMITESRYDEDYVTFFKGSPSTKRYSS